MADLPAEIMVWRSSPNLSHVGTWATTRYPEEAMPYVPKADVDPDSSMVKSVLGYTYDLKAALKRNPTIIQAGDDICAVALRRIEGLEAKVEGQRAQVAAAYDHIANVVDVTCDLTEEAGYLDFARSVRELVPGIRSSSPADARDHLDTLLHEARLEGARAMREVAANECAIIVKASSLEVGNPEIRAGKVNAARKLHDRIRAIDPEQVVK